MRGMGELMPAWKSSPKEWIESNSGPSIFQDNFLKFSKEIHEIVNKLVCGQRISVEEGLNLVASCDLPTLGALADYRKNFLHGKIVYYNRNLHVNQTNICVLACKFCAFRRGKKQKGAYQLSVNEYLERIRPFANRITEVHTVGGLHPDWDLSFYTELFSAVKKEFPKLAIKALTAVEIKHLATISNSSVSNVLTRLKQSGLDTIPGGGAEILINSVRDKICLGKETSEEYLSIHCEAHKLDIQTNCTMLFGTVESMKERLVHLDKLRTLQDETNGFQCFVPYPYLPDHSRLPEAQLATSNEILRTIAISRLMLDNIPHIKAYRMNLGDQVAQLALLHGADDIDGTVGHEEIMHDAGSETSTSHYDKDLITLIDQINCIAVERNTDYSQFRRINRDEDDGGRGLPLVHG